MIALLSGEIGAGKTTICQRVLALARKRGYRCGGLLTPAIFDQDGNKIGIEALDPLSGQSWTLARADRPMDGPQTGRYHFEARALQRCLTAIEQGATEGDLLLIDEIGPLELEQEKGLSPVLDILLHTPRVLVVVRSDLLDQLARRWLAFPKCQAPQVAVFTVTEENREALPEQIGAWLFSGIKL